MDYYRLLLYIFFGVLPSLIWLSYYLRKDKHPEPKIMIIEVFLYGACITVPVFFLQIELSEILSYMQKFTFFSAFPEIAYVIKWFLIIAATEEIFKYLVVKLAVFQSLELDEPMDLMIYMIVAALGFAALENILYLFAPQNGAPFSFVIETVIAVSFIRFVGATFLHTLASATAGYFLALSFLKIKSRKLLTVTGISVAIFLHGLYNFSIITLQSPLNVIVPLMIIAGLALFVNHAFGKVKNLKSICKI